MARHQMSDKEKMYFFCLLFPPLWVFIPVMALCDLGEAIVNKIRTFRRRRKLSSQDRGTP